MVRKKRVGDKAKWMLFGQSYGGVVARKYLELFFFQAEDGIRDWSVTGVQRVLFRSEEHTSGLQSLTNLVCRLLLRSEERRVGKERRSRWSPHLYKKQDGGGGGKRGMTWV